MHSKPTKTNPVRSLKRDWKLTQQDPKNLVSKPPHQRCLLRYQRKNKASTLLSNCVGAWNLVLLTESIMRSATANMMKGWPSGAVGTSLDWGGQFTLSTLPIVPYWLPERPGRVVWGKLYVNHHLSDMVSKTDCALINSTQKENCKLAK